jgi:hypothetical protein
MGLHGHFTPSDLVTIDRAATLAERITLAYFNLPAHEWKANPYGIFTRKEVDKELHHQDAFAHVFRYRRKAASAARHGSDDHVYGIALQDPNILRALLRSAGHDLWTLCLFTLTHELTHILRFRKFGVDFFAPVHQRDEEENIVHAMAHEMLVGVANTDALLELYKQGQRSCGAVLT